MAKYKTRASAIEAVTRDGKLLADVEENLKDDELLVTIALKNGGQLASASVRLQNNSDLIITEAYRNTDNYTLNFYDKALFCSKRDLTLCEKFSQIYRDIDEFQILMLLHYGKQYTSKIAKYNSMSVDELKHALYEYRKHVVETARDIYKKARDGEYISSRKDLVLQDKLFFIHSEAIRLRFNGKPFSNVGNIFVHWENYRKQEIESYCSRQMSGSYPERIVSSLLSSLNVDFSREQIFPWSTNIIESDNKPHTKRYDFYIPEFEAIIEVHGSQHYGQGFEAIGGRTLDEEQNNDRLKEELAKKNGIKHYIVINALESTLGYIRQSIVENNDFNQLFNLSNVDWTKIHSNTISKVRSDLSFPLFEEITRRYNDWINVIKETQIDDDCISLTSKKDRDKRKVSAELKNNISTSYPSKSNLYPHEIMALKYAPKYKHPYHLNRFPNFWFDLYGIHDVTKHFDMLLKKGFLKIGDVNQCVEHATVVELKKILTEHDLSATGNKAELVKRTLNNINVVDLEQIFSFRYLQLTELGEIELVENEYLMITDNHELSIWSINRLHNAFPNQNINDILSDYAENPLKYIEYLSEEEKQAAQNLHLYLQEKKNEKKCTYKSNVQKSTSVLSRIISFFKKK